MTEEFINLYVNLFDAMHQTYRVLSMHPDQKARADAIRQHTLMIGQGLADEWGMAGLTAIMDEFEQRGDMLAVSFLDHKWNGVRLPDGGTWVS